MINKAFFLLIVISAVTLYQSHAQNLDKTVNFQEVYSIGKEVSASPNYLFRDPQQVVTDTDGNIFISDRESSVIKVYDNTGKYLYEFGRKGRGPGEFQDITALSIRDDKIIVFDSYSQRFTELSPNGEVIETIKVRDNGSGYLSVNQIMNGGDSTTYAIAARTQSDSDLIHELNSKYRETGNNIAKKSDIWDMNEGFLQAQAYMLKINAWMDSDRIFLSPTLYQSKSLLLEKEGGKWQKKTLEGFEAEHSTYEILDNSQRKNPLPNMSVYSGRAGKFVVKIYNKNIGSFIYEGKILNFFLHSTNEENVDLGVDIFSLSGEYEGYHKVEGLSINEAPLFDIDILWLDENGYFYISDTREIPKVRVMKLSMDGLK